MKIPFDIKYRPQIESGEYKVCINYNWPVKILSWDCIHVNRKGEHFPILAKITCMNPGEEEDFIHWYNNEGKYDPWDNVSSTIQDNDCVAYCPSHDLFIVTPEEELTEWEKVVGRAIAVFQFIPRDKDGMSITHDADAFIKKTAAELLTLAREQFIKDGYIIEKKAFHDAVDKVSPEVMNEVSENIDKTGLTEFEKRLVKFYNDRNGLPHDKDGVCNRRDLDELLHNTASELLAMAREQLQPEIDAEIAKADSIVYDNGVLFGKAEALKDLPRWKKVGRGNNYSAETKFTINGRYLEMNDTLNDVYEVPLSAFEKLPRFKED